MKTLLTFAVAILLAQVVQAQIPNPVLNPKVQTSKLQELWRADNLGYGIKGITWLENFYDGKGALVVSTPSGVQTWLMRYPWDTLNVFSWGGGDANIKSADFTGDGIADYLDTKGNIYLGRKGTMPLSIPSRQTGMHDAVAKRTILIDLNKDGLADIVDLGYGNRKYIQVAFGNTNIDQLKVDTLSLDGVIDDNNTMLQGYATKDGKLRVVLRHYTFNSISSPPYINVLTDGYRMYDLIYDSFSKTLKPNLLDEYSYKTPDNGDPLWASVLQQVGDSTVLVVATANAQNNFKTRVTVRDITSGHFKQVQDFLTDSLSSIISLNNNVGGYPNYALCFQYIKQYPSCYYSIYPQAAESSFPLLSWKYNDATFQILKNDQFSDTTHIVGAGSYSDGLHSHSYLSVWSLVDSVSTDVPFTDLQSVKPIMLTCDGTSQNNCIRVVLKVRNEDNEWILRILDIDGREIENVHSIDSSVTHVGDESRLTIGSLRNGVYVLCVTCNGLFYSTKCIVE